MSLPPGVEPKPCQAHRPPAPHTTRPNSSVTIRTHQVVQPQVVQAWHGQKWSSAVCDAQMRAAKVVLWTLARLYLHGSYIKFPSGSRLERDFFRMIESFLHSDEIIFITRRRHTRDLSSPNKCNICLKKSRGKKDGRISDRSLKKCNVTSHTLYQSTVPTHAPRRTPTPAAPT